MVEAQAISPNFFIILIVITGMIYIYKGLQGILIRKIRLMGNFRTARFATGKYAVFYGLGMYIFGISFIYIISSTILLQLNLIRSFVYFILIGLITTFFYRIGYRDPKLLEIENTDKEFIMQQEQDPIFIQKRKRKIILLVILSFLIGIGIPLAVFIINIDGKWTSEHLFGFSGVALFLTILCLIISLKLFLMNKQIGKW